MAQLKMQCHLLAVGHSVRCDETVWQKKHFHSQAVNGMRWDEIAWQKRRAVLLTSCWSWDVMWPGRIKWHCHYSHAVTVGMMKTRMLVRQRALPVLTRCQSCDEMWYMAEKRAVTLTRCWSRDEIGIMSLPGQGKGLCLLNKLFSMAQDVMSLPGRKKG